MKKIIYTFVFSFCFIFNVFASNNLTIDVDSTENKKINIIFEDFYKVDSNSKNPKIMKKILKTVKNNLNTTKLFLVNNSDDSIFSNYKEVENLSDVDLSNLIINKYSKKNIDAVLSGFLKNQSDGKLKLEVRLWDILDQRELFAKYYIIDKMNWKRVGDILSDSIYEMLTGEISGHFDSKIIFVAENGKAKNRKKRIAMIDFNGDNLNYITNGKNLVLTPIFSKFNKNEIIHLEYNKDEKPHLFKLNLAKMESNLIGSIGEMSFAPNFNPNGNNEIVFSATKNGYSNIYKLNFDTRKIKQLTYDRSISTVPSWSPDGERIVFVSDKTGVRKLYVMDKEGSNVERISDGRGSYDKPSWSPDGKLISFVKLNKGEFSIGLMTPDGRGERNIMNAYLVEGIKWSPNGRYLIYSKQKGPFGKDSIPKIYTMDILNGIEYKVPTPENQGATDPDWIRK